MRASELTSSFTALFQAPTAVIPSHSRLKVLSRRLRHNTGRLSLQSTHPFFSTLLTPPPRCSGIITTMMPLPCKQPILPAKTDCANRPSSSPQGRIFQVEYAQEAVKQGSVVVGLVSRTHAVLVALKVRFHSTQFTDDCLPSPISSFPLILTALSTKLFG